MLIWKNNSFAQHIDSVFTSNLIKFPSSKLDSDCSILITGKNCVSCVEYLSKRFKGFNTIIVTDNKSLNEYYQIMNQFKLHQKDIYWINKDELSFKLGNKGPNLLINNSELINYDTMV